MSRERLIGFGPDGRLAAIREAQEEEEFRQRTTRSAEPNVTERAFAIADESMFELLRSEACHGGDDKTHIGLVDEDCAEVAVLDQANKAMRDAYAWLSPRGYVRLERDDVGEFIRVVREPVPAYPPPDDGGDDSRSTLHEERNSQHVLKAEGASPDATDREICALASPDGGPMGVGQAAAAAPLGGRDARLVIAENCEASDAPGAWTCVLCGFRGFWQGAPHCIDQRTADHFAAVRQRQREIGATCRRPFCPPNCQTCPEAV